MTVDTTFFFLIEREVRLVFDEDVFIDSCISANQWSFRRDQIDLCNTTVSSRVLQKTYDTLRVTWIASISIVLETRRKFDKDKRYVQKIEKLHTIPRKTNKILLCLKSIFDFIINMNAQDGKNYMSIIILKFWPCTNKIYKSGRTSITMDHQQRDSPHRIDEYLRNLLLTLKSDVDDKGTTNDIRVLQELEYSSGWKTVSRRDEHDHSDPVTQNKINDAPAQMNSNYWWITCRWTKYLGRGDDDCI